MSMSDYPIHESAALLISPAIAAIINGGRPAPEGLSQEEFEADEVAEAVDRLDSDDCVGFCCISEFTGELYPFNNFEESGLLSAYEDDFVAYIRSDKEADLFTAAYTNFDELVAEFKGKLADLGYDVPDEVLRANIVEVNGSYFG